jgi:branched-chain amino acid transport system permease protein
MTNPGPTRALFLAALAVALPLLLPAAWRSHLALVLTLAIGTTGQNLLIGHAGIVSLGQAGFLAVGAYTLAHLAGAGVPPILATLGGALAAGLTGALLGLAVRRLTGAALALATLAFATAVHRLAVGSDALGGGPGGLAVPVLPSLGGVDRDLTECWLLMPIVAGSVLFARRVVGSPLGRALAAARECEPAARASGVDLASARVFAFTLSSVASGLEGALEARRLGHIDPAHFTLEASLALLVAVIVGGRAPVLGPLLGAAFVVAVPALAGTAHFLVPAIFGLALATSLLASPEGLAGLVARRRRPAGAES